MTGFRRKLRQFRKDWVGKSRRAKSQAASTPTDTFPPRPSRSILGFLFNADDTPRWTRPEREQRAA